MIVAHRGYSGKFPENSIPAFKAALDTDADFVELDVRRTRDKRLVVIHDRNLKRLFGVDVDIHDVDFGELRKYSFDFKGTRITVPLLEDVLGLFVSKDKKVIIELKEQGYESAIISVVREVGLEDQVVFASFNFSSLHKIKMLDNRFPVLPISNVFSEKILRYAIKIGAGMLALRKDAVNQSVVRSCLTNGVMVNAWVINDFREVVKYFLMGVNIVSTDYPLEISQFRANLRGFIKEKFWG